jgi:hypothetical protein
VNHINVDPWDELLHRYVNAEGRVNYRDWTRESRSPLLQWLEDISNLDIERYSNSDERLALWINLYNALTIAQVLDRYPIPSIRPTILGVPNWIGFFRFFSRSVYRLGDRAFSLGKIEHDILRREFRDPRIHFALVCASIGCPLLRNQAYRAEIVHDQLAEDARRFIRNPDKVHYNAETGVLYCSKIFKWYRQDFLSVAPSIPDYINAYLEPSDFIPAETPIRYLPYDWSLNEQN